LRGVPIVSETWTKEQFWSELDKIGESEVRLRLATKQYSDANERGPLAQEWLRQRELDAAAAFDLNRESTIAEQIRIARSEKSAAWAAGIAAAIAVSIVIISAVFVYLALRS
jgi:hypothetical protein